MKKQNKTMLPPGYAKADEASTALLNAARTIFITEGIKGLSVRRVAESAGCTTMTLYSRFKDKEGILAALFDEGFDVLSNAQNAVDPALKNEDRLVAFCQAYRATAHAFPHHYALMMGQFSGDHAPSVFSQAKAIATLDRLTDAVANISSMKSKKRAACVEISNRLFAFCHGWVSLERTGIFGQPSKRDAAFNAAVLSLIAGKAQA
jgi:AcrR family transcriptional regulator